jgi:tetratricopeptide (TPR) repeat protein
VSTVGDTQERAIVAPLETSTSPGAIVLDEDGTRPLAITVAGSIVDLVVDSLAAEAEALLGGGEAQDRRLADLNVQLAFAAWDIADDPDDAIRHLELAERHPLAPALRLAVALDDGETAALEAAHAAIAAMPATEPADAARRRALLLEVAEGWLYRHADPKRALAVAKAIDVLDADVTHLIVVAAIADGDHETAIAALVRDAEADAGPADVAAAVAATLDRGDDPKAALELACAALARAADHLPQAGPLVMHWVRVVDLAIEAAIRIDDPRLVALLQNRNDLLQGDVAEVERAATELLGAIERRRRGDGELAHATLARLADSELPGLGGRVAALGALHAALADNRRPAIIAARERLAHNDSWAIVHAWRALELADVAGDRAAVDRLAPRVHAVLPAATSARILERANLGDAGVLAGVLEAEGGANLRRAAAVVDTRLDDTGRAIGLLRARTGHAAGDRRVVLEQLVRLLRRARDAGGLAAIHEQIGELDDVDVSTRAAHGVASGTIHLTQGRIGDAERVFARVARIAPDDTTSRIALAALYRRTERWSDLAETLEQLAGRVASRVVRGRVIRERAEVLATRLGDTAGGRAVLEAATRDYPDDPDVLRGLAILCEAEREWPRAIELLRRALDQIEDPMEQVDVLIEIARAEDASGAVEAALASFESAARIDPSSVDAIRGQAGIHRRAGRTREVLDLVRRELVLEPEPERRIELELEIAGATRDDDPDAAIAAYDGVLAVHPAHPEALDGIERIARAHDRWTDLARALRGAPSTPVRLATLAEALENSEQWADLAQVRRSQLEISTTPADRARLALVLAKLYEDKLGDPDGALRLVQLAHQAVPTDATHRDQLRLLEAAGHHTELAAALERELTTISADDIDRQVELLSRIGEIRATRLGKPGEAALAYEAILQRQPGHGGAIAALEATYQRLGKDKDLIRILEAKAEATPDRRARGQIYLQIARTRQQKNDVDGAIAAYLNAVKAEPSNRDGFTALERLCYKHERWPAVLQLYEIALADVEAGNRSYRLSDLHARRGQVQLDYLNQPQTAAQSYAKVVELDPGDDTAVSALKRIAEKDGDWSILVHALERRADAARDPARRISAMRLAATLSRDKLADPPATAQLMHRLVALDPRDTDALDSLEAHYERAGEWAKLIDVLRMRVEITPAGVGQLGLIRRIAQISEDKLRDVDVATEHYTRILEQDPTHREALEALGRIYESTEQWAEFVDVTRRQIRVTTDRNFKALLYFKCGSVMEAKFGREEDAIRYYDAAIKTTPSCMPAVHGLRDLYRRREDWPRVIQTLELEVKLWTDDKERAGVFAQIGRIYEQRMADPKRAMTYYESALSVDPECVPANQALFEHYFDGEDWGRALPLAQALAQKAMREGDPQTRSDFYRQRGTVLERTGDPKAAAESFIVALEIRPTNVEALDALVALARRHPDSYDFDATLRELDKQYKKRDDGPHLSARVKVGQAVLKEREGDLDSAGALYGSAAELAPGDFTVLSHLLDYACDLRRWTEAIDAITRFLAASPSPDDATRVKALMRRAEIHADGEMSSLKAISVLQQAILIDPTHQDAHYRLAQECYLLGRHPDARAAIDRVIELSTAPGATLSPPALARYYYYKGRIMEAAGDPRGAAPQYRRATEYDPGYAPPALVLARRAAEGGDQRQAETVLIDAAHAAMDQGGPRAAVPLQRGLARILLGAGDRPAAIEAYRGILNVEPDSASDRVALAEIYAVDDPARAIHELRKVIERDIHNAPAYRLLTSFYSRVGETERAARVGVVMDQLGFAEDADRATAARLKAMVPLRPLRRSLDDDTRSGLLVNPVAREPIGEIFNAAAEEITALFPPPPLGERLAPIQTIDDPLTRAVVSEVARLYGTDAEVYVGDRVPGAAAVMAFPRRLVVVDRTLLGESEPAKRWLFGWAFEAIRGNYALVLQLGARQRRELAALLRALLMIEVERPAPANEFARGLPRRAKMVLDRFVGRVDDPDAERWIDGMIAGAKRGGLLACDDFAAATWMVARLAGEMPDSHDATVALGAVLGGPDLVRFYLSDDYSRLRAELSAGTMAPDPRVSAN